MKSMKMKVIKVYESLLRRFCEWNNKTCYNEGISYIDDSGSQGYVDLSNVTKLDTI